MSATALGDLVLMMGEDEVQPAAMDIEGHAQQLLRHSRALDMPAGPALAPGTVPAGLAFLGRFPQDEIAGTLLVGRNLDPRAGD